jgi:hypothetical protein
MRSFVAGLAVMVALTGCLQTQGQPLQQDADATTATSEHAAMATSWRAAGALDLRGAACEAAGGLGQNPNVPGLQGSDFGVPAPFEYDNTWPYFGLPDPGLPSPGNWHLGIACTDHWEANGRVHHMGDLGIVALAVKPPPFEGLEPAEHNFLVSTIATRDETITQALHDAGQYVFPGVARVAGLDAIYGWRVDSVIETAGDGIYTTRAALDDAVEPWSLVRFWLIVEQPDGLLHVAAWDMSVDGGTTYIGKGSFSHSNTGKHYAPRADRLMGAVGIHGFDFAMTLTVLPDTVEGMWDH